MKVRKCDLLDAQDILESSYGKLGVSKSNSGERMNEVKAHINWAKKVVALAEIYGTI